MKVRLQHQRLALRKVVGKSDRGAAQMLQIVPERRPRVAAIGRAPDAVAPVVAAVTGRIERAINGVIGREKGVEALIIVVGQPAAQLDPRGAAVGGAIEITRLHFGQQRGVGGKGGRRLDAGDPGVGQRLAAGRRRFRRRPALFGDDIEIALAPGKEATLAGVVTHHARRGPTPDRRQRRQVEHRAIGEITLTGAGVDEVDAQPIAQRERRTGGVAHEQVREDDVAVVETAAEHAVAYRTDCVYRGAAARLHLRRRRRIERGECGGVEPARRILDAAAFAGAVGADINRNRTSFGQHPGAIRPAAAVAPEETDLIQVGQFGKEVARDLKRRRIGGVDGVGHDQ